MEENPDITNTFSGSLGPSLARLLSSVRSYRCNNTKRLAQTCDASASDVHTFWQSRPQSFSLLRVEKTKALGSRMTILVKI